MLALWTENVSLICQLQGGRSARGTLSWERQLGSFYWTCAWATFCIVSRTVFPSILACMVLPISSAWSAFTGSPGELVNPVEKDTRVFLSLVLSKGITSYNHPTMAWTASLSFCIWALVTSVWTGSPHLFWPSSSWWLRVCTQDLWADSFRRRPLFRPPEDLASHMSVVSMVMSVHVPDHSWSENLTAWFPYTVNLERVSWNAGLSCRCCISCTYSLAPFAYWWWPAAATLYKT